MRLDPIKPSPKSLYHKGFIPRELIERAIGFAKPPGIPQTKIVEDPLWDDFGYHPAPLVPDAVVNGVLKWEHAQGAIERGVVNTVLIWLSCMYGGKMTVPPWTPEKAREELDRTKASGMPYSDLYGHTKGDVLDRMSNEELEHDFQKYVQYFVGTLKDELIKGDKLSRFFLVANVVMTYKGNQLFGAQNEALASCHAEGPIRMGMPTPGQATYLFFRGLSEAIGDKHQYDGRQSDSKFALIVVMIICEFRKSLLPESMHKDVNRYYDMAYCMRANCLGAIIQLFGMPTGHTNTASDNCLGYLILNMVHAVKHGLSYDDFTKIYYGIMGDDMVLSDPFGVFGPLQLEQTFNQVGMFLECPALVESFDELTFMGMHPQRRRVFGTDFDLYSYRVDKLRSSANYLSKKMTPAERLAKLASLATLTFAHEDVFRSFKQLAVKYLNDYSESFSRKDTEVMVQFSELWQLCHYTGLEPSQFA